MVDVAKSYSEILYEELKSDLDNENTDIISIVAQFETECAKEYQNEPYDFLKWKDLVAPAYAKALMDQYESGRASYCDVYLPVEIMRSDIRDYLPPIDSNKLC